MKNNHAVKVAILNSRQTMRPIGIDPWITNTSLAVRDAIQRGYTLLTSVGMNSWEIVLYFASRYKAFQKIYIPLQFGQEAGETKEYYIRQFRLDKRLVNWHCIKVENMDSDYVRFQTRRDNKILHDADIIYPIALRGGGNLDLIFAMFRGNRFEENRDFNIKYMHGYRPCKIEINPDCIDYGIDKALDGYFIHWTRACNGPWPDDTYYEYYDDITKSEERYPRSALDTLIRIYKEQILRASPRHYHKGISAVAFSALPPTKAIRLMQWRSRYHEMTFEPYGIAIEKSTAAELGIRGVFYGNPEMHQYLEKEDQPYFQGIGTKGFWMPEKEYRHLGDIDLNLIPSDKLKVIVWQKEDINIMGKSFGGEIHSLYKKIEKKEPIEEINKESESSTLELFD
jgi:hypothetical protein